MALSSAWRLRTRLALISLIGVVPALGIIVYSQFTERSRAQALALENARRVTHVAAGRQAGMFNGADRFLSTLAQFPEISADERDDCSHTLARALRDRPTYINVTVVRPDGSLVCAATPLDPRFASSAAVLNRAWFRQVMQTRKAAVGDYGLSTTNGQPGIVVAHPILGQSGAVERILAATLAVRDLQWVVPNLDVPPGATLTLFDRQRTILAIYPNDSRWIGGRLPEDFAIDRTASSERVVETAGLDGIRRVYTLVPIATGPDSGLLVAMGREPSAMFVESNRLLWRQLGVLLFVSLAALGAGLAGGEFFVRRPIETITTVAARLSTGDFTARATLQSGVPGMTELGGAINAMAVALDTRQQERDRAEQQLRESEYRHRELFEKNPHPVWVYDPETLALLAVNDTAVSHYGYTREEFLRLTVKDLHPRDDWTALNERPAKGIEHYRGEWRHRTKDGRTLQVDVRANLIEWNGRPARLALIDDVTDRKQLEDALRQSQKMEAIGQLAGGVAHDFNNLLTAIQGYAELVSNTLDVDDVRRADVAEITHGAQRAAALTRQLLAFSRKQILSPCVVRVGDVVRELAPMLHRVIGETIELRITTADNAHVKADVNQLEQVIMNLVVNARDAMGGGGHLGISAADVSADEDFAKLHPSMEPGSYVVLTVSDTGHGMDATTQARIFEPFYTTKAKGKGTGLGLSTVYGIVKQSQGYIWVSSEVNRGSTFSVYLPQTSDALDVSSRLPEAKRDRRGDETILLVEDEDGVRKLVAKVLRRHGYRVHTASRAGEALAFAQNHSGELHLLLTDVVLPDIDGRTLANRVLREHPEVQVLLVSGYADDVIVNKGVLEPGIWFLQKPFSGETLMEKVREILDALA